MKSYCSCYFFRRIAGPGLASEYYFQIKTEQALVALEAKMEREELLAFQVSFNYYLEPKEDSCPGGDWFEF